MYENVYALIANVTCIVKKDSKETLKRLCVYTFVDAETFDNQRTYNADAQLTFDTQQRLERDSNETRQRLNEIHKRQKRLERDSQKSLGTKRDSKETPHNLLNNKRDSKETQKRLNDM